MATVESGHSVYKDKITLRKNILKIHFTSEINCQNFLFKKFKTSKLQVLQAICDKSKKGYICAFD